MVPFNFSKKTESEKQQITERFYVLNVLEPNKRHIGDLEEWCKNNLSNVYGKSYSYKDVVCALPNEIKQLADFCEQNKLNNSIPELKYIVENLYHNMRGTAQKYLFENLNTNVCPFCNRNYIYVDLRMRACDFDHFYPKSKYPLIAASFYNLIPTCPVCNRQKNDKLIHYNPHGEYQYDKLPHFKVWIKRTDYLENDDSIEIEIDGKEFEPDIRLLRLHDLYKSHKDIARNVLLCKSVYSEKYLNELARNFGGLTLKVEDLVEKLYGIPKTENDFVKNPLSKLKYEVWKQ